MSVVLPTDLCVLGDLSMVGTVNRSQRIVLWNYRTFECVGSFPITAQPIARSSPSGIYSIGGYRGGGAVCCGICYLPKQQSLAVGCNENVVIWHVPSRQITHTLTPAMAIEAGQKRSHYEYAGVVLDVAVMPDRERLVAMSRDALRVWSLSTLNPPLESLCETAGLPPTHAALKKKKSRSSSTIAATTSASSAPNSPMHGPSASAGSAVAASASLPATAAAASTPSTHRASFTSASSVGAAPLLIRSLSADPAILTAAMIDTKHSDPNKDTKHSAAAATATASTTAATASAASVSSAPPVAPPLNTDNAASASAKEPEIHRACKCLGSMSDSRISFSYGLVVASESVILSVSFGGRVVAWNVDTRKLVAVYAATVACDAVARVSGGAYGSARVVMQQKPIGGWDYDWDDSSSFGGGGGDEEKRALSKLVVWEPDPRHPPPPISDDDTTDTSVAAVTASTACNTAAAGSAPEPLKPQTNVLVDSKINPGFPVFRSLTVVDADHLAGSTDSGEWVVLDLNRLKIVARFSGRDHSEQTICSILE